MSDLNVFRDIFLNTNEQRELGIKFNVQNYYINRYKSVPVFLNYNNTHSVYLSHKDIIDLLKKDYNYDVENSLKQRYLSTEEGKNKNSFIYEEVCDLNNGIIVHLSSGYSHDELCKKENGLIVKVAGKKDYVDLISSITIYHKPGQIEESEALIRKIFEYRLCFNEKFGIKLICKADVFYTSIETIKFPEIESLCLNYGSAFEATHKKISDWLNKKDSEGIILLHGPPGTGKTSYLRYLIEKMSTVDFIYMPPGLSEELTDPTFIPFLIENKGSTLIIEDAENILKDRQDPTVKAQAIANLLNVSDGLLGDSLEQKIIATFNCELDKLDPALLRKGRLISMYKFDKLSVDDAKKLAESLGIKKVIDGPMTLAEIYNP